MTTRPSYELIQRYIDQLPGTAYLKDSQLRLLLVNQHLANILGTSPEALVGKTNSEIFPADFAAVITQLDELMLQSGGSQTVNETFLGRHFETSMFVMDDPSGERLLGGLSMDVTDRFHAAERTQALLRINELGSQVPEKELLTAGLELAQALTHSEIGFLHFVNDDQQTLELVTWTAGALRGCTAAHDTHYPISQAGIWADCFRQKAPVIFNDYAAYAHKRGLPDGHTPLLRMISVPVLDGDKVRMMIGVGNKAQDYDTTDTETLQLIGNDLWRIARRARVELALKERVAELAAVNQKLSQAHVQLLQAEKMASIGQLAAGVAHEINNPISFVKSNLGAMSGYLDTLLDIIAAYGEAEKQAGAPGAQAFALARQRIQAADLDFMKDDLTQLLDESRSGIQRVSDIVRNLRDFAQPGAPQWQWTDLHTCIDNTLALMAHQIQGKAQVTRQYGKLPDVFCQASQLGQALLNVLANAVQAFNGPGHITLRTGCQGTNVWLEVQDDGCGIDAANLPHVFDPFFTTKPVGQATGMGLAVVWGVVEQHHGRIEVNSTPGQGTCFKIILPIAHAATSGIPTHSVTELV